MFDEEGFYCLGDAARFEDPEHPEKGLVFDGRVTEDFKLDSGTWVSVGTLRPDIVAACAPLVFDAVVCGQDKKFIGALLWPSPAAMAAATQAAGGDVGQAFGALTMQVAEKLQSVQRERWRIVAQGGAVQDADLAAVAGHGRDHRQGLCEPAHDAGCARGGSGLAVRGGGGAGGGAALGAAERCHASWPA